MRDFIEAVLGEQRGNVVMSLVGGRGADGKPVVNRPRWFEYPKDVGRMVAFTEEHGEEDVYLSPIIYGDQRNERDKITRAATNALTCQAIYMDSDACPPGKFRLPPSIHVDTSVGHGHDYWLLTEPVPARRAAEIAHRITTAHKADGTDPSGWSSSKFLRMPTVNLSYAEPFPVVWEHSGLIYSDLDVEGAYDDVEVTLGPEAALPADEQQAPRVPRAAPAAGRRPDVLEGTDLAPLYDRVPASNTKLIDLLEHIPKVGEKGWRSEQRWGLLLELFRAGFNDQETLSLAWHASATSKWREDARGVEGLWFEVMKARNTAELERGVGIEPAERVKRTSTETISLLDAAERKRLSESRDFVQKYLAWASARLPVLNRPLHEINAWTYLAVTLSEVAVVWKAPRPIPLNLFTVSIAESSSGKSEAATMLRDCLGEVYPWPIEIGTDHSKNALVETMLDRQGDAALASSDEADEMFSTQRDQHWTQGVQQAWTVMYDGYVPPQNRVKSKGESVRDEKPMVKARLSMHMVGTPEALFNTLDRPMFKSGYLARMVWVRGQHTAVTPETLRLARPWDQQTEDETLMPRYWAERTWRRRNKITGGEALREKRVIFTEEAYQRIDQARITMSNALEKESDTELFRPLGRRLMDVMQKACAMVALTEGRTVVTTGDALVGIAATETWLDNALAIVNSIASSEFSRACDEIEAYIAGREGRTADASRIFGLMRGKKPREVEDFLDSLVKQGRIEIPPATAGGPRKFKIKGDMP